MELTYHAVKLCDVRKHQLFSYAKLMQTYNFPRHTFVLHWLVYFFCVCVCLPLLPHDMPHHHSDDNFSFIQKSALYAIVAISHFLVLSKKTEKCTICSLKRNLVQFWLNVSCGRRNTFHILDKQFPFSSNRSLEYSTQRSEYCV
jgi:hypothetical protein